MGTMRGGNVGMRWLPAIAVVAALVLVASGCGSASPPATSSGPATPVTRTSVTASAISTAGPILPRIEVPSLGLLLPLTALPCSKFSAAAVPDPPASSGYFIDCTTAGGGFLGVIALRDGILKAVATATAGTAVKIFNPVGTEIDRTIKGAGSTLSQNPDGTWPGHGVPPGMPVFIELRASGMQTEVEGDP